MKTKARTPPWFQNELTATHDRGRSRAEHASRTVEEPCAEAETEKERAALLFTLALDVERRFPLLRPSTELLPLPGGTYTQVRGTVANQLVLELSQAAAAAGQRYRELRDAVDKAPNGGHIKKRAKGKRQTRVLTPASGQSQCLGR